MRRRTFLALLNAVVLGAIATGGGSSTRYDEVYDRDLEQRGDYFFRLDDDDWREFRYADDEVDALSPSLGIISDLSLELAGSP